MARRRVYLMDDERGIGNGIIVTLSRGWTWESGCDNRVRGFDTLAEAQLAIRKGPLPFAGPFDS